MKTQSLGKFRDDQGNTYEILEATTQIPSKPLNGSHRNYNGFKEYKTTCGIPINFKNNEFITWRNVVLKPIN